MRFNNENQPVMEHPIEGLNLPLYFLAEQNCSVQLNISNLEYSSNNSAWNTYTKNSVISLNAGDKVYFRGNNSTILGTNSSTPIIKINNGKCGCYGLVASLYNKTNYKNNVNVNATLNSTENAYANELGMLFYNQTNLTHGPSFRNITNTNTTATAGYALGWAFQGCTNLVEMEDTSVLTVFDYYLGGRTFKNCSSLVSFNVKDGKTVTINKTFGKYGGHETFNGCTSLTDVSWLKLNITTWQGGQETFNNCTGLIYGPTLLTTGGAQYTYVNLFNGCSNLQTFTILASSWYSSGRNGWLGGCDPTKLTIRIPRALPEEYASNKLLSGCTIEYID